MARTTEEIYNSIVTEITSYTVLAGLISVPDDFQTFTDEVTSNSKVGVARHIIYGVSYAIHTIEVMYDKLKAEIEALGAAMIPQTDRWMVYQTKAFQYGDALVWDGTKYTYAAITTANQIVAQCAVITVEGKVLIKVAKDAGGSLSPLTVGERDALTAYWNLIRAAGTNFQVISEVADDLAVNIDVVYDPLVMNSDGTLRSDGTTKPVDEAITSYLPGLSFNGRFWTDKLVDAIQAAEGVTSVDVNDIQAKYGLLSYTLVDVYYDSFAGHMAIDSGSSTINYLSV